MAKRAINIRIDGDLLATVDALAAAVGADRTALIERSLRRETLHHGEREFIYALVDLEGQVRYVGRSRDPHNRLRQHLASASVAGSGKDRWLHDLLQSGKRPQMVLIDDVEPEEAQDAESRWITHFAEIGQLTNGRRAQDVAREEAGKWTNVRVRKDIYTRVAELAAAEDRSARWWVERALEAALTNDGTRRTPALTPSLSSAPPVVRADIPSADLFVCPRSADHALQWNDRRRMWVCRACSNVGAVPR